MRYEGWTFRETEVRLKEHYELRKALSLGRTPDYTTLYRFMQRLEGHVVQRALREGALQALPGPVRRKTVFAVDATGLARGAISTFFIQRKRDREEGLPWRYWLKWVAVVDTRHQFLLAQIAKRDPQWRFALHNTELRRAVLYVTYEAITLE